MTLEEGFKTLAHYGAPMLMQVSSGRWHCVVTMRVNATGVTFEVKATADDPNTAMRDCVENMLAALATVSATSHPNQAAPAAIQSNQQTMIGVSK